MSADTSFRYRAKDASGIVRVGSVSAKDEPEALRVLMREGLQPLSMEPVSAGRPSSAATFSRGAIKDVDRIVCLKELATLIEAGVSIAEGLPSVADAYRGSQTGAALERARAAVSGGAGLVEALASSGLGLPAYALALLRAGEASGEVAASLLSAASQLEEHKRSRDDLRGALTYPAILVAVGSLVIVSIVVGVVPRFANLLQNPRADVPELARWVIGLGVFARKHGPELASLSTVLLLAGAATIRSQGGRRWMQAMALNLPGIGPWLRELEIGRWATVLGELLSQRVPIVEALNLSASSIRFPTMAADVARLGLEISRGRALAESLADIAWFPPNRINLVRVGERGGALPRTLAMLGKIHAESARSRQRQMLALVEPVAILLIGGVIGLIMVAVMSAITSVNSIAF